MVEGVRRPDLMSPGYMLAFVTVTLAGVLQAANAPLAMVSRPALIVVAAAAAVYALLGTLVLRAVHRCGTTAQLRFVFVAMTALGIAATVLSYGYATMMLLAVVSAGIIYLDKPGGTLVCLLCAVVACVAFAFRAPLLSAFIQAQVTFGSGIAFVIVFSRLVLEERRARAEVERLAAEVEKLATEKERNRIAREIHDGLGHYMTVAHVQLEAAQTLFSSDPERARAALATAQKLTREGLGEVRRSVALLRGAEPARPLVEAIRALAEESAAASVEAGVRVEGVPRRLAEPVEFTLYRTTQEALTNAHRHARASRVEITLQFTDSGVVRVRVGDDGVGAGAAASQAWGFGLVGMRERAELVGGTLSVTTGRDRGFTLELEVPG